MKTINLLTVLMGLLFYQTVSGQTSVDFPTAKNVLVVCKKIVETPFYRDDTSYQVLQHYVAQRNIPDVNIFKDSDGNIGLDLPTSWGNPNHLTDSVDIVQHGEVIKRRHCDRQPNPIIDSTAWLYYEEKIATPIRNYLNNTIDPSTLDTLKNQIRYIVLCKGFTGNYS